MLQSFRDMGGACSPIYATVIQSCVRWCIGHFDHGKRWIFNGNIEVQSEQQHRQANEQYFVHLLAYLKSSNRSGRLHFHKILSPVDLCT